MQKRIVHPKSQIFPDLAYKIRSEPIVLCETVIHQL